ncbi:MAG: TRAP-type C4-dicarboxylate transport system, periplasmic component [Rhodobacteraceae bacterium HLUCCA12]|nr:MAG: TRAP-type C4-dicarboxylate transport system, periplasmic component [Rhodobacteraceae bacterium HLUCCA12]
MKLKTILALSTSLATVVTAHAAIGQEITMRVADVYPTTHPVPNSTIRVFMEEVESRVGDQIGFEYYPAQQLGSGADLLSLTQEGVVDIGLVVPSYISDILPLSAVSELPGAYGSSCEGTMAMHELMTGDGILAREEFNPNDVRVLITHAFAPFQAFSTQSFESLASYEGQKLRTLGLVTDLTIESLGATPIRISAPEINEAMSRGTIDGGLLGVATVLSYDLVPYVRSGTYGESFGGAVVTYTISHSNWERLSPEVQEAMTEAGRMATLSGCEAADDAVDTQYDTLRDADVQIVELSEEDAATFATSTARIGETWAESLNERGRPGTEVLEAFRAALAD